MRCDQLMGLPLEAVKFLEDNRLIFQETCPHCGHTKILDKGISVAGYYTGMFEDQYELLAYKLKDGRTATEFVQAQPWSSGPCFFIGLRLSDGTEFLHDQEIIDNA